MTPAKVNRLISLTGWSCYGFCFFSGLFFALLVRSVLFSCFLLFPFCLSWAAACSTFSVSFSVSIRLKTGHRRSFCARQGLRICLVENSLDHLLLLRVQNLRQVVVKLWLLLLEVCVERQLAMSRFKNSQGSKYILKKTCLNRP